MIRMIRLGFCLSFVFVSSAALSQTLKDESKWLIEFTALYGDANGRLQTPAGGQQGSVTPSEPQFDESGTLSSQLFIGRRFGKHMMFFNYRDWGFSGSDTYQSLPQNNPAPPGNDCVLIQNAVFCNGEEVEARVDMNWYSLGYAYTLDFTLAGGRNLMVRPSVQIDLYRFEMEIDRLQNQPWGTTENGVDRRYNKGGVRFGGILEYAQNDWLVWGLELTTSLVTPATPGSTDVEAYASFRLWDSAHTRGNLRAGIGYTYFRYTDQQTVPNDLIVEMGPSPLLAFAVQF